MIKEFIKRFDAAREELRAEFKTAHPEDYEAIVKAVVRVLGGTEDDDYDDYNQPDVNRIHVIDDGDWQGTLVFVIGARGYQPSTYWYTMVGYGSCSGCDTLQRISSYSGVPPTDRQADEYMTLALHIVQKMRVMDYYSEDDSLNDLPSEEEA